ncbi:MAG: signal peptidase II [Deltaproteobacteria bacterium]|nr:signal peptidase II [Deltaproteobacteria bacterium]
MSRYVFVGALALAVVGLDQAAKWAVQSRMELYQSIPLVDGFFHLTYVRNSGGAFGFLRETSAAVRLPFFIAVSSAAVVALLYFVRQVAPGHRLLLFALGGILGGALGNLIDRMTAGTVVDFLDVHWRGWYWPTFNVADSFISTGVVILLLHSLFVREEKPPAGA